MNRRNILIAVGVTLVIWYLLRRFGVVTAGAPTVKGKVNPAGCRAGEIYRGGFCATPEYFAELDRV
jgi:hypothetical protein